MDYGLLLLAGGSRIVFLQIVEHFQYTADRPRLRRTGTRAESSILKQKTRD